MPKIDINRLRRFHGDAKAAAVAVREVSKRLDDIRNELIRLQRYLAELRNPKSGYNHSQYGDIPRENSSSPGRAGHEKNVEKDIKKAQADYAIADAEHDRLIDLHDHARSLWVRCREYAAAQNALPDELKN